MKDGDQRPEPAPVDFGQLGETTGFLVRRLHNSLVSSWNDDIAGSTVRVTPVQAGILVLVAQNPGVTQAKLLKALDVESATLVKCVTRMVEMGLLHKKRNRQDRRAYLLHLTDHGRRVHEDVSARMRERDRRLSETIPPEDRAVFLRVLRQLVRERSKNGSWS